MKSAKDAQLWCHWKRIASRKSRNLQRCPGMVTKHLPEQLQSCWPPNVLFVLSVLGDLDLESPRAQTPTLKEGGTVDLCGWGHSSQHLPQESCLTAPQGTQDTHSSWSLSPLSLFKSMKELTFLACNFSNRVWNLNMWAFSYALRIGFVCQKYFLIVCICLHVYLCSSMYSTHMHERTTFGS